MWAISKGCKCYYEDSGQGKKTMVLLHGWGQNTEMMKAIALYFAKHFRVINLDFPGFGQSENPPSAFSVQDYADFLAELLQQLGVKKPILVAHSFGCRVALHYSRDYPVEKMVLTGAAGVRDKRDWHWYWRTYSYKLAKRILRWKPLLPLYHRWQKKVGSSDYQQAQGVMRETFVKVVNDDVSSFLPAIDVETLLVFGELDTATPVAKGEYMAKQMPRATLIIFAGDDHYAYFHQALRFNRVLEAFLQDDY